MTIKTILNLLFSAFILVLPTVLNAKSSFTTTYIAEPSSPPCSAVTNIQVEMMPGGKALISWDEIQGVPKYHVILRDNHMNVVLDTIVTGAQLMVSGLQIREEYNVEVCYDCPKSEESACSNKTFNYIIVEDLIVTLEGGKPCSCDNQAAHSPSCGGSQLYDLIDSRVYTINTQSGVHQSFVVDLGQINPVGNCESNFNGLGYMQHGVNGLWLAYYDLGTVSIFFHGTQFCVQGDSVVSITYCELGKKSAGRSVLVEAGPGAQVMPNPFDQYIQVNTENESPEVSVSVVRIFDGTGRLVGYKTCADGPYSVGNYRIATESLEPGAYWLTVMSEGKKAVVRQMVKI